MAQRTSMIGGKLKIKDIKLKIKSKNFLLFIFLLLTSHFSLSHRLCAVPASVSDLTALPGNKEGEIILTWTAPGNDGTTGTVDGYGVRYRGDKVITNSEFSLAILYSQSWTGLVSGSEKETRILTGFVPAQLYYFAIISSGSGGWSVWNSSIDVPGINTASSNIAKLIPPSAVNDLSAVAGFRQATLTWTSPGDDGNLYDITGGTFDVRYTASGPISNETDWNNANYKIVIPTSTVAGSMQKYTITGLTNGTTYYFAIKTRDENKTGWSEIDSTVIEPYCTPINTPPLAFSLISPADGYISIILKPSFDWADTTDPDAGGSISSYSLEYSFYSDFPEPVGEKSNLSYSSYTFIEPLTDDRTYYWRAKAIDVDGGITRTSSRVIYINTSNLLPTTFYLLTPADKSTVLKRPLLTWEASTDHDPPNTIKYTIYYSSYSDFSTYQTISNLTSPNYTFTSNLTENTTYYWKVAAIDQCTPPSTVFSEKPFSFYIKPVPPAATSNVKITNGIISWSPVLLDEDGSINVDFSTYKVYRSSDIKIIGSMETLAGYTTATSTPGVNGFWTVVRAVDNFGNESANSVGVNPAETKQILISKDREVIIEFPSQAQLKLSNVIISISKSGGIYDIKALNSSDMSEINGFAFPSPVKITFETSGDCVYWHNGVEYVALGGKKGNSITIETTKLGKFYTGTIASSKLKLVFSFPTKIFTPNNDGINDEINLTFTGVTEDITDAEIFDITGKKIADMTKKDYSRFEWNGKNSNGKTVLPGVYIYQVKSGKDVCNGTVVVAR